MMVRAWSVKIMEAKRPFIAFAYRPGFFTSDDFHYEVFTADKVEALRNIETVDDAEKACGLGDIIDARECPFWPVPLTAPIDFNQVIQFAKNWATELAAQHFARENPSFYEASQRMTAAYGKLFELEQKLRVFVELSWRANTLAYGGTSKLGRIFDKRSAGEKRNRLNTSMTITLPSSVLLTWMI
ncbi:MAG: hypothetical protein HY535_06415 [Chloroflexi bacterium]|nr:hypothetical protein [Chloroflexota bacterium]